VEDFQYGGFDLDLSEVKVDIWRGLPADAEHQISQNQISTFRQITSAAMLTN